MLLVGEPDSGKTTLLRSAAAFLAGQGRTVTVVDERQEVWPEGGPAGGEALDVIAGLPKGRALQMALRTLSPHVILLDELGGMEEVEQLEQGFYGGVNFVASLHASTLEEAVETARQSEFLAEYLPKGLADRYFTEQLRRCAELRDAADPAEFERARYFYAI